MKKSKCTMQLSIAEKTGAPVLLFAMFLFTIQPGYAVLLLSLFLLLCLSAPFFFRFGFYLPIISRGTRGTTGIALTFDDGPSPASTPAVLDLLARHGLQATFFVVGKKAARYPELVEEILARGHTVGNHSWQHDPLLMFRLSSTLQHDIHRTQEVLSSFGIRPLLFRPPAGITNPRLGRVLVREALVAVTYSCRAVDRGNRNIRDLADRILQRVRQGDIIVLHDLPPAGNETPDYWIDELDRLFAALANRYLVRPLEEIIDRPVMETGVSEKTTACRDGRRRQQPAEVRGERCLEHATLPLPTRGEEHEQPVQESM